MSYARLATVDKVPLRDSCSRRLGGNAFIRLRLYSICSFWFSVSFVSGASLANAVAVAGKVIATYFFPSAPRIVREVVLSVVALPLLSLS